MTRQEFTVQDRQQLAEKLRDLGAQLPAVEQAYLAAILGLGCQEIQRTCGAATAGGLFVEFDAGQLPALSQAATGRLLPD